MPVVPRIEMPPTMPSLALVVLTAMSSPPGTEKVTSKEWLPTSSRAVVIIRRGTGLMAGAPTGSPSPGLVTVPTPSPASKRGGPGEELVSRAVAVMRAPSVQSGSSPASFTTTAQAGPSASTGKRTRRPPGRATSTSEGTEPVTRPMAAALAAAEAQVPVVQPVRRPGGRVGLTGTPRGGRGPTPPASRLHPVWAVPRLTPGGTAGGTGGPSRGRRGGSAGC